jgi:hypothetical protein
MTERAQLRRAVRICAAVFTLVLVTALFSLPKASATGGRPPRRPSTAREGLAAVPVPGDHYAPGGTTIVLRGIGAARLSSITVVGSVSGPHAGTLTRIDDGVVFAPQRPFAPGEIVTVRTPGVSVTGAGGHDYYQFGTATPASPAMAAKALRLAAATDQSDAGGGNGQRFAAAPTCTEATYHSTPFLHAPQLCMNLGVTTHGTENGTYLFATPSDMGAGIWTDDGELVWWHSAVPGPANLDETVVHFHGEPLLAVWSGPLGDYGTGYVTLYNEHYQVVGKVTAAGAFAGAEIDLHEFQVTPDGDALFGIYDPVQVSIDGSTQTVLQYVVQKVSLVAGESGIETGQLLFEWDSLSDVPVTASQVPDSEPTTPWDYFHGNAITLDTDGNIVVSSRNTWGIYKIDDTPADADYGHVVWQVGAAGDSQLQEPWCYQHDITALGHDQYSLFDDGGLGPGCAPGDGEHASRALVITVDPSTTPATVTLDNSYVHSPPLYAEFTGSAQRLADGNMLVDWGSLPEITEYSDSGSVLMDLTMSDASYRGLRYAWDGQPLTQPAMAMSAGGGRTTIWTSWNGATAVAAWRVIEGPSASQARAVGKPIAKTSFESEITLPTEYPLVGVEALSASGAVVGVSKLATTSGYLVADQSGKVSGLGNAAGESTPAPAHAGSAVTAIAESPGGGGDWLVTAKGAVFASGDTHSYGSAASLPLAAPMVGIAATPDGRGYWLAGGAGGVFSYGDAKFYGSAGQLHLAAPIVAIVATPDGHGYWMFAADGGIFAYGDAHFYGSLGGTHFGGHVVSAATTPDGHGYWIVTSAGGVFSYGDSHFHGSLGATRTETPIVSIAATNDGDGYWLTEANGHVSGFGDAPVYSPPADDTSTSPVVAITGSRAAPPSA